MLASRHHYQFGPYVSVRLVSGTHFHHWFVDEENTLFTGSRVEDWLNCVYLYLLLMSIKFCLQGSMGITSSSLLAQTPVPSEPATTLPFPKFFHKKCDVISGGTHRTCSCYDILLFGTDRDKVSKLPNRCTRWRRGDKLDCQGKKVPCHRRYHQCIIAMLTVVIYNIIWVCR